MADSRCWSTLSRHRLQCLPAVWQRRPHSDHKSDHPSDHDCLPGAAAALRGSCGATVTLLTGFRAAGSLPDAATFDSAFFLAPAPLTALLGGFCAALPPEAATFDSAACLAPEAFAALLGGFCVAALRPEAATFDSAAGLAPAAFAASFGIAASFAPAAALLFGITLAFAALLGGVVTFEREAAMPLG